MVQEVFTENGLPGVDEADALLGRTSGLNAWLSILGSVLLVVYPQGLRVQVAG